MANGEPEDEGVAMAPGRDLADVPAALFAGYVVLVLPVRGLRRYRALAGDPGHLVTHYRNSVIDKWLLTGIGVLAAVPLGLTPVGIGLSAHARWAPVAAPLVALAVAGTVMTIVLRRTAQVSEGLLRSVSALLPRTHAQRRAFAAVAVTAGITEEILFRGVLTHAAQHWGASPDVSLAAVSAVFGLGHLYQGKSGILLTGLAGAALGSLAHLTGSLWVPIAVHVAVDLRVLLIVRPESRPESRTESRPESRTTQLDAAGPGAMATETTS